MSGLPLDDAARLAHDTATATSPLRLDGAASSFNSARMVEVRS